MQVQRSQSKTTLLEIGCMFLPAVPATLWVWANLIGKDLWNFQVLAYLYVLGGTLWIIHRHWSKSQIGLTLHGLLPSRVCGVLILAERQLIISSIDWIPSPETFTHWQFARLVLYYFVLVGFTEEILFRGLLYTTVERWQGARWAVLGSSLGFMLWHIFGHGVLIGITTFFIRSIHLDVNPGKQPPSI